MHYLKFVFNAINYVGYCLWGFSTINFLEQLLNDNFNYKNINSFLSACAAIVALVFAIFKLLAYIRDSKIKSKLLEQELIALKHYTTKWNLHEAFRNLYVSIGFVINENRVDIESYVFHIIVR